jgi:hypothetical protein
MCDFIGFFTFYSSERERKIRCSLVPLLYNNLRVDPVCDACETISACDDKVQVQLWWEWMTKESGRSQKERPDFSDGHWNCLLFRFWHSFQLFSFLSFI